MRDFKLLDAELVKEDGTYYITTKYRLETDYDVREVTISKVPLPLNNYPDVQRDTLYYNNIGVTNVKVDLGYGRIMIPDTDDPIYIEKVIEEKVEELTIEEIEKRIGHKIKIVNKKVPIKNRETCDKCYWRDHLAGGHCVDCSKCKNRNVKRPLGERCNCFQVKEGEPCPYFKEDK